MSCPIHFISNSTPGYSTIDAIYLSRSNSSRGNYTLTSSVNFASLRFCFRHTSICNAGPSYYRRNPDFSKQNKNGLSLSENRPDEEIKNGFEDSGESKFSDSKSGPLLGNRKPQTVESPNPRDKEIVELFRKFQVQLRERSAVKEEKRKVENYKQGTSRENETVDSILKILRKHSVQPEEVDNTAKHGMQENPRLKPSLPKKSDFSRRSPVPEMESESLYSEGSLDSVPHENSEVDNDDADDIEMGSGNVFAEMSEDEISDNGEEDEQSCVEVGDVISGMKLVELRAVAKSRGVKGFSKFKKNEIIELLSGISV